ncbi:MAG: hydrogenase subunit MbhD domain-containing protein, partial [Gammaproteobacteria bacterium]
MLIEVVNIAILALLAITAIAAIRLHDLFAVAMMFGIYSLLASVMFVVLDAIDVAFTEAAVGVGISTVLMLGTIGLVGRHEQR